METIEQIINRLKVYAKNTKVPIIREKSGELLEKFVQEIKPKKILEIGTAIGYSGILMLKNSPKDCELCTIELDEERVDEAKINFQRAGMQDRVKIMIGDATEIIPYHQLKYDFILLDGPKGKYYEMLPYLVDMLNVGGGILIDNVLYFGMVEREKVWHKHRTIIRSLRNVISYCENDKRLDSKLIRIEDGLIKGIKVK